MIVLSRKSWHYGFNTWCWGEKPTTKSLCPYFWATLLGVVLSPLILLFKGLMYLIEMWTFSTASDKLDNFMDRQAVKKVGNFFFWLIFGGLCLFHVTFLGAAFYHLFSTYSVLDAFKIIGIVAVGFGIIIGICYFFTSDTWDMIKGMAYGIKNKVCPMLTFKD